MNHLIAATTFDCYDRAGEKFCVQLRVGNVEQVQLENGQVDAQLSVSFEPLFNERKIRGIDSFQTICIAIVLVRDALRAFTLHGGKVCFPGTLSPINIDSPTFAPFNEPIDPRFL
jgi:hypothetical protein